MFCFDHVVVLVAWNSLHFLQLGPATWCQEAADSPYILGPIGDAKRQQTAVDVVEGRHFDRTSSGFGQRYDVALGILHIGWPRVHIWHFRQVDTNYLCFRKPQCQLYGRSTCAAANVKDTLWMCQWRSEWYAVHECFGGFRLVFETIMLARARSCQLQHLKST